MRVTAGILCGAIFFSEAIAASSDLEFCSKLSDRLERLVCYDAAARIAETKQQAGARPVSPVPGPILSKAEPTSTERARPSHDAHARAVYAPTPTGPSLEFRGPFHGAYAAIGAAYGGSEPTSTILPSNIVETLHPHGPSAIAAMGYNLQNGSLLVGLELAGRYGRERAEATATGTVSLVGVPTGSRTTHFEFYSEAAAHLSARVGLAMGDTLAYGRFGFGATHLVSKSATIGTGVQCQSISFDANGNPICTNSSPIPSSSATISHLYPSALFGVGIEHNFGDRFFARLGAEAEVAHQSGASPFWLARGIGMVGTRF